MTQTSAGSESKLMFMDLSEAAPTNLYYHSWGFNKVVPGMFPFPFGFMGHTSLLSNTTEWLTSN